MKKIRFITLCLLLLGLATSIHAHQKDSIDLGFAIKISYAFGKKVGGSVFTGSAAIGVSSTQLFTTEQKFYYRPTYQLAFNVYKNGLGNNMLKKFKRIELDIVNSLSLTGGYMELPNEYVYAFKTHNNMTASYALEDRGRGSLSLSTNFTFNNYGRNQQTAYLGVTAYFVRFGYYNDGQPFGFTRMVDGDDRYWTGGGFLQIGDDKPEDLLPEGTVSTWFNRHKVIVSYERFTGDVQDAYKLSTRLGLTYVPVKEEEQNFYNRGNLSISLANQAGWQFSLNWLGHYPWDVQDVIHKKLGYSKHYSFASNHFLLGVDYNRYFLQQKIK